MNRSNTTHVVPAALLAAIAVLLLGCGVTDETPAGQGGTDNPTSPTEATRSADDSRGFVVLLDDDADPDQIEGEPGSYAMTARGATEAPWAVVDVPAGFTNFGFFAVWP